MNVGNTVVHVLDVGTIVGVSQDGDPIVEWVNNKNGNHTRFSAHPVYDLLEVALPVPNEELSPNSDWAEQHEEDQRRDKARREEFAQILKDAADKAEADRKEKEKTNE